MAQVFILGMLLAKLRQLLDQKAKISQHGCPKKTRVAPWDEGLADQQKYCEDDGTVDGQNPAPPWMYKTH